MKEGHYPNQQLCMSLIGGDGFHHLHTKGLLQMYVGSVYDVMCCCCGKAWFITWPGINKGLVFTGMRAPTCGKYVIGG